MKADSILFLSGGEVRELLTVEECVAAVECAFRLHGEGKTLAPAVLGIHVVNGGFHVKAGILPLTRNYFAAKVNANFPGNPAHFGLPTIQGIIMLCDAENGEPLAVLDSREITTLRTAAATAVAAKYLARADSRTMTICGCGTQGRAQLAALARSFPLEEIYAFDTHPEQCAAMARELGAKLNVSITVVDDLAACLRRSDICVTCTPSTEAFVGEGHIAPGTFIAAVGADNPHKQEIQPGLMARSKVVCDVLEQCAAMGDLHHALKADVIKKRDVYAELGEIVAGRKPGRQSSEEVFVFDSTGMALQDVAATAIVYEKAIQENAGTPLRLAA